MEIMCKKSTKVFFANIEFMCSKNYSQSIDLKKLLCCPLIIWWNSHYLDHVSNNSIVFISAEYDHLLVYCTQFVFIIKERWTFYNSLYMCQKL